MPWLTKAWNWLTNNPIALYIAGAVATYIAWQGIKANLRNEGAQRQRDRTASRQAEVRVVVTERQGEILREETDNANAALEARDSGAHYPTFDSMPDAYKRVLNRRSGSDSGS